ncbi:unnamed protein product [Bursaphelenchus okinawaensis]|uniref:Glutaredoxin domain-containing protein n=1 Tax=Bursaphelenchus okinawaensis TaxID=465554 RepID=A0A811KDD4_9BILA|nr:unnamed protein product [Bursaphelenchus okinawaensis]CAG9102567.1 unnamed protein product [Bursaphelenchus okinawaensis]
MRRLTVFLFTIVLSFTVIYGEVSSYNVTQEIDSILEKHNGVLFIKTHCSYSNAAIYVLKLFPIKNLYIEHINMRNDTQQIQDELYKRSGITTVPQFFINQTFYGNYNKIAEAYSKNQLYQLLKDADMIKTD